MKSSRALGVFGCMVLGTVVAACSGSDGAPGKDGANGRDGIGGAGASVSGVIPGHAYLARTLDVTLSGFGTTWDKTTKVDFGQGIAVNKVQVASPTALIATISIDKAAAAGPRDVKVGDQVYTGGFTLESPVKATVQGTAAQGSVLSLHLSDKDLSTPFDTTSTGGGLLSAPTFTNLATTFTAQGITGQVGNVNLYDADLTLLVDVTAPAADSDLDVDSGPAGAPDNVHFPAQKAFSIKARTPTALTSGTAKDGNITDPLASDLYQFTPTAPTGTNVNIIDFLTTATDPQASPALILLPKSGKFADILAHAAAKTFVGGADPFYAIYWDNSGGTGTYSVTATATSSTTALADSKATAVTSAQDLGATLPVVVTGGSLASATSELWLKYNATAADATAPKKLRIQTVPGDAKTDTVVEIFKSDGTTTVGGPSDDADYGEDWAQALPAAGTYFIKVSASTQGYSSAHKDFQAVVRIQ
jgi:hypothetical protein